MPFKPHKTKGGKRYYTKDGRRYTSKQVRAYYATKGFKRQPRKRGR